jgi:3-hydroxybutyryl-CoA dehydrogenase
MTSRHARFGIATVGIVRTGAMGRGIAQIAALAGLKVRLYDADLEAVRHGDARESIAAFLKKRPPIYR